MTTFINRASHCMTLVTLGVILVGCGNGHPSDTGLHEAARMNDPVAVKAALSAAPGGVDTRDSQDQTPLIAAAKVNALDSMQLLLDAGADVNARDIKGNTALMWAVRNNQAKAVKFLMEHKADPNLRNNNQETALLLAAKDGYADVVAVLIDYNGDAAAVSPSGETPVQAVYQSRDVAAPPAGKSGDALVHPISHNTDIDAVDTMGARADNLSNSSGNVFSSVGQSVGDLVGFSTPKKWTALQYAVKQGRLDIVKMLLAKGANPNTHDSDGWTPLLYAADAGYLEIVKRLVEKGANPKVHAGDGVSPLDRAEKHGYIDTVNYLKSVGAQ